MKTITKILFLMVLVTSLVFARGNYSRNQTCKLDLSDKQTTEINKLRTTHQKEMITLRAEIQTAQIEKNEIYSNENISEKDINAQIEKINKIRTKMDKQKNSHKFAVLSTLNEDQKKIYKNNMLNSGKNGQKGNRSFNKKHNSNYKQNSGNCDRHDRNGNGYRYNYTR